MYNYSSLFYKSDKYNCKSKVVDLMSPVNKICDEFRRKSQLVDLIDEISASTESNDVIWWIVYTIER